MEGKSSPNRERFIIEYCVDFHGTKAAIRAGYNEKSAASQASRLLRNANIKAAIERRKEEMAKAAGIDALWALNRRVEIAERCMTAEPVRDKEGNETGEYTFDASGANKALDAIEKIHLGMMDKSEVNHNIATITKDDESL